MSAQGLEREILADVARHPASNTVAIAGRLGCDVGLVAAAAGCLEQRGRLERSRKRRPLWSIPKRADATAVTPGFAFFARLMQSNTGVF